jgi:hypothetical protein
VRVNNWFTHLEIDWVKPVWQHWSEFQTLRNGVTVTTQVDNADTGAVKPALTTSV